MGYELLENSLTDSTLWMRRSLEAKVLAITILSKCEGSDRVYIPVPILIERARLTPEQGAAAFAELTAPDPDSRCELEEGRFVVPKVDDDGNRYLWLPSYAGRRRRYLARERKRLQREREAEESRPVTPRHAGSHPVTPSHDVTLSHAASQNVTRRSDQNRPDQIREKREKESRFAPPSLADVRAYASEKNWGRTFDAQRFLDFYESKGWKVGKVAMRDWKAAARNARAMGWTTEGQGAAAQTAPAYQRETAEEERNRMNREANASLLAEMRAKGDWPSADETAKIVASWGPSKGEPRIPVPVKVDPAKIAASKRLIEELRAKGEIPSAEEAKAALAKMTAEEEP